MIGNYAQTGSRACTPARIARGDARKPRKLDAGHGREGFK